MKLILIALLLFLLPLSAEEKTKCLYKETFTETRHETTIEGRPFAYKAVAGTFLLKNQNCEPTASLFFISYTKEGKGDRPITFCFNGGPGSSSVWLNLGLFGPKRVQLGELGHAMPPYALIDNEYSLLDLTDLVFIDPVSTGFSQAIPPEEAKKFHGVEEDIRSVGEFIRLYLTRFDRWQSAKFIVGESYGSMRAVGLANHLHDSYYINVNGLILISSILNFNSVDFSAGNDLSALLFLPSYTATAWYHNQLSPELQKGTLQQAIEKARQYVVSDYVRALFQGSQISGQEREATIRQLSTFTGLSPAYIAQSNLRIDDMRFMKELLRHQNLTVGRFDSRFTGQDGDPHRVHFEYDPSMHAIFGAFTATFNEYVKNDLKWESSQRYQILTNVQPWDYGSGGQCFSVGDNLRSVITKNSNMTVFVASGYYDLATPFYGAEYTFSHLGLPTLLLKNITLKNYEAGHMMYIHLPVLQKMKGDLAEYYFRTLQLQKGL